MSLRKALAALLAAGALLLASTGLPANAGPRAENEESTDAAFDALLSLPQGLSDDSRFPTEGDAPADEAELQAILQEQLDSGANVNAYRHEGTLLLHALRGGLESTALWLLAHGADPRLEVGAPPEPGSKARDALKASGDDALQVALIYRRWRVVDALLRRPQLKPQTDTDRAFRWSAIFNYRGGTASLRGKGVRELLKRGLPLPGGWQGDCLLARALDEGLVSLVIALPAATPKYAPGPSPGRDAAVAGLCLGDPAHPAPRKGPSGGDKLADFAPADLAKADARLTVPLLPSLLPTLKGAEDAAALARLPLRRPYDDPAFMRSLVAHALDDEVPPTIARAVLSAVPPASLSSALDDKDLLKAWLTRFGGQPVEAYAWALKAADDGVLRRHVETAISATSSVSKGASAAHWQTLLARLPTPLDTPAERGFVLSMPDAAWPALFAHRYTPSADELATVLATEASQGDFARRWTMLRGAATPQAQAQAFEKWLQKWSPGCSYEWFAPQPAEVARVKWLVDSGLKPARPATLAVSCEEAMPAPLRATLIGTRAVVAAPPAGRLKFVLDTPACEARPEPELLRALVAGGFQGASAGRGGDTEQSAPQLIQAVAEPGRTQCAWLVSGGNVGGRAFIEDESFYDGHNRLTPCLEATLFGELWRVVDGKLQAEPVGEGAMEGSLALKETSSGRRYLLTWPVPGSTCDAGHAATLLGWTGPPSAQRLSVLGDEDPVKAALQRQCHLDDLGPCFGLPSKEAATQADAAQRPRAWDAPWDVEEFVDRHWQDRRKAFIEAFVALDMARLNPLMADGVAARWRAPALAALNASALPVEAKRQRTAWMFRDKPGLKASFGSVYEAPPEVLGLVAWLPREDWRPMVNALAGRQEALKQLRDAALAKKDARLACVFSKGMGEACVAAR